MQSPPKPVLTPNLSFGNVLTIVTLVVGGAIAWGQLTAQLSAEKDLRLASQIQFEQSLDLASDNNSKVEQRLRDLEQQQARVDERFTMILTLMTDLKAQVTKLAEKPQGK